MSFLKWGYKRYCCFFFGLSFSLSCHSLWALGEVMNNSMDISHGVELSPLVNIQGGNEASCQQPHELAILEASLLALVEELSDGSLANTLTTTSRKTLAGMTLCWSRIPDPQKQCEIINVCCFKLLNWGMFCYTAIDN